ncbi:uncharacterized protein B0H18DRAFT_56144 [Fomitopsis serialis]|uniref:uncharacterized protein n=1 Tax=Fomitopsis serialis TaxID=139415 RepID=UPI00200783BF|nr:uncharacterized protein B0H18DRAFT_56144 [Neoantrodia serialis]KAH9916853.1 hypothetical protein B0H18DRAFT_56144 [Neoantrodia serialis]
MIRNAFVKTVRDVEDAVGAKLEDTATMAAAVNMSRLNAMLCNEGTQYLFTLPSLKERIASATVPDVRLPSYFAQSHPRVNLLNDDRASSVQVLEAMDEVSTDSGEESEDTTASFALRYMRSIVAWVPASRSVHSNLSKLVRSSIPATIHVVNSPPPVPSSVSPLDVIARNLPAAPEGHTRAKARVIMEELGIPEQVRGAVHSEAALMAFIHRARDRGEGSLVSSPAAHDLDDALQGTTGVIGSAVKCCWCCAWLAEHLARHTDPHQTFTFKFHVAGSHGRIGPWAPPTGVPSAVLEELRTVLQEKLSSALKLKTYDPKAEGVASDRRHGGPASTTTDEEIFMSYASNPAHDE